MLLFAKEELEIHAHTVRLASVIMLSVFNVPIGWPKQIKLRQEPNAKIHSIVTACSLSTALIMILYVTALLALTVTHPTAHVTTQITMIVRIGSMTGPLGE